MENLAYYNGKISSIEEMTIPLLDRAVYFGDGVYDVTLIINHKPYALEDHVNRFFNSCSLIRIDFPMSKEEFSTLIMELAAKVDSPDAMIYWQASRGTAPRAHVFPGADVKPNLMAYIKPFTLTNFKRKVRLITEEDTRFFHCNIKTLNLIPNVMASQKAAEAGCYEAVFHRGPRVTECSHSNISILKDGVFRTAPLDNLILPGISRKHILEICHELNIPTDETPFTVDELREADEVLISSSTSLFAIGVELDGRPVGGKAPELLDRIAGAYEARINALRK